jgi:hypothetical protein
MPQYRKLLRCIQTPAGLLVAVCLLTGPLAAQDVVYFAHPRVRGESRLGGEVLDFKGKQLTIRIEGETRTLPAERIVRIDFRRNPRHAEGDELFARRDFGEARHRYLQARIEEGRPWVQRLLLAQLVWCDQHTDQLENAAQHFLRLVAEDADTPYFEAIPLAWLPRKMPAPREAAALKQLAAAEPVPVLLAASYLLMTRHRSAALDKLQTLRFHADARVAGLARAQIWRAELVTASSATVAQWAAEIEKIPPPLRAGAYFALGSAQARHAQTEDAVHTLLRVPLLYPRHRVLAARCLKEAAGHLESQGRADEALALQRELVTQYAETRDAEEQRTRQKEPAKR